MREGRNEAIPVMPFHRLADIVGNTVKAVKSESIKKAFKLAYAFFSAKQTALKIKRKAQSN